MIIFYFCRFCVEFVFRFFILFCRDSQELSLYFPTVRKYHCESSLPLLSSVHAMHFSTVVSSAHPIVPELSWLVLAYSPFPTVSWYFFLSSRVGRMVKQLERSNLLTMFFVLDFMNHFACGELNHTKTLKSFITLFPQLYLTGVLVTPLVPEMLEKHKIFF